MFVNKLLFTRGIIKAFLPMKRPKHLFLYALTIGLRLVTNFNLSAIAIGCNIHPCNPGQPTGSAKQYITVAYGT